MINYISLRKAIAADLDEMKALYRGTIMEVCSGEYDEKQRKVWASSAEKMERWAAMIESQYVLLAVIDGRIAGFATLDKGDYIDFLYVHKDFQRMGVADRLLTVIEEEARRLGSTLLTSDISMTARPFFEKKGYRVIREQENEREGLILINYKMEKNI